MLPPVWGVIDVRFVVAPQSGFPKWNVRWVVAYAALEQKLAPDLVDGNITYVMVARRDRNAV